MRTHLVITATALLCATNCTVTPTSPPGTPINTAEPVPSPGARAPAPIVTPPKTVADVPMPSSSRISASIPDGGNVTAAGQTFTVVLAGRAFDRPTEGGGFDLTFNPSVVQIADVAVDGSTWEFFTKSGTVDNVQGTLTDLIFASFAGRSGDFPIATITFKTVAPGSANLRMTESTKNPFASGGRRLAVTLP